MIGRYLGIAVLVVGLLMSGCDDSPLNMYHAEGIVVDRHGAPVEGITIQFKEDRTKETTDERGRWRKLRVIGELTVEPKDDTRLFYPPVSVVSVRNPAAEFVAFNLISSGAPSKILEDLYLALLTGNHTHTKRLYSNVLRESYIAGLMQGLEVPAISTPTTQSLNSLERQISRIKIEEVDTQFPGFKVVRTTGMDRDLHLLFTLEDGRWKILLPGTLFISESNHPDIARTRLNNVLQNGSKDLRDRAYEVLLFEASEWIVSSALNRHPIKNVFERQQKSRLRSVSMSEGTLELALNEDLVNVENAYRGRLTIGAPTQFKSNASKIIRQLFAFYPEADVVKIEVWVPVFVDDYGNIEEREIGTISMDRNTYRQINWDTIRTEMIVEHLNDEWWY